MQLVKTDIHNKTGHTGGYSIYSKALATVSGIFTSITNANASDYADFAFDLIIPFALTPTKLGDGTLDGSARAKGFKDYQSYLEFQKRLEQLKKDNQFKQ